MALSDTSLRNLKPAERPYCESDGGGLFIEVLPTGKKRWALKYRTPGRKQETVRLGDYPAYSLAEARAWREECKALVKRGLSPMALKRGDCKKATGLRHVDQPVCDFCNRFATQS